MPLDRRGNLRLNVVVFARPLDQPVPCSCETHALPCAMTQHFVLTLSVNGEPEEPWLVLEVEGHA
jgi:hypothetical protein